ncbi:MAG: hypothetical protein AUG51_12595 [Acidobacteria bacterium 13_1_20CM_3_53_8]|nr:MAG: hypothetical protein AUG51_12595 [Acidobacteria bacterium 13_1_20CM_3_53_8]
MKPNLIKRLASPHFLLLPFSFCLLRPRLRVPASLQKWLFHISRFALAALFLFAVGAKLYFINDREHSFLKMMPNLVGERWALPVVIAVFVAESAAVILLLWRRTVRIGALWAAALLISFAAYALYYRYGLGNSEGLECGCFGGIIASQLGVTTALRNLLLLIPCAIIFLERQRKGKR